ncbi:MAG: hypothetical protein NVS3B6_06050 [Pseudarthrobacter sp.]
MATTRGRRYGCPDPPEPGRQVKLWINGDGRDLEGVAAIANCKLFGAVLCRWVPPLCAVGLAPPVFVPRRPGGPWRRGA